MDFGGQVRLTSLPSSPLQPRAISTLETFGRKARRHNRTRLLLVSLAPLYPPSLLFWTYRVYFFISGRGSGTLPSSAVRRMVRSSDANCLGGEDSDQTIHKQRGIRLVSRISLSVGLAVVTTVGLCPHGSGSLSHTKFSKRSGRWHQLLSLDRIIVDQAKVLQSFEDGVDLVACVSSSTRDRHG